VRISAPVAIATCAALLVAPGAHAAGQSPADGPATVILPACAQSSGFGEALVPGCSYVALPKKGGGTYYAYLTASGEIRMAGSLTSGKLSLPATGQTWPGITVPGGFATVQVQKADITGTVDAAGSVTLSVPYKVAISAGVFGSCTAKGTVTMSSSATDPIGGGQGSGDDPTTQGFAVAGTSSPTLTGGLCAFADDYLDLSRGLGWYLDGSLALAPSVAGAIAQTASVRLPARIKRKGRTVLLTGPVVTNANQAAAAALTWGTKRSAKGTPGKYARVTSKGGKVTIRTTGRAKKLFVRLTLRAPATPGFRAFSSTRVWVVR
jgi:hypothetical protein